MNTHYLYCSPDSFFLLLFYSLPLFPPFISLISLPQLDVFDFFTPREGESKDLLSCELQDKFCECWCFQPGGSPPEKVRAASVSYVKLIENLIP